MAGDQPSQPRIYHPRTVEETLRLLQAFGDRATLVAGPEIPAGLPEPPEALVDVGRLAEMAGVHQFAGSVTIGLNATLNDIAHTSLVRMGATCLAEACERDPNPNATLLNHLLRPPNPRPFTLLALLTLAAEVDVAFLDPAMGVRRTWRILENVWEGRIAAAELPLAVRFAATKKYEGSALADARPMSTLRALSVAACARVGLAGETEKVETARVALLLAQGPPKRMPETERMVLGRPIGVESIEAAAHAAQSEAETAFRAMSVGSYDINPTAHLVRLALDHAAARGRYFSSTRVLS
ncbi:MAG: hypothetical protein GXP42_13035 [Chloroflexi bacterium]|nr:hypothetical protein [Chloroflexota bacterium]